MSKKTRQRLDADLKAKVALRLCNKATVAQLAAKYQLHPNQIYAWNKRVVDGAASDFLARRQKPDGGRLDPAGRCAGCTSFWTLDSNEKPQLMLDGSAGPSAGARAVGRIALNGDLLAAQSAISASC
jgi:hypothetical protein